MKKSQITGTIDKSVVKSGVVVLTFHSNANELIPSDTSSDLGKKLIHEYSTLSEREQDVKSKDCVVDMRTTTADSPVIRALFDLYKTVAATGGKLIVVGYPVDYIASLEALGLTTLPGFRLSNTKSDAMSRLSSDG